MSTAFTDQKTAVSSGYWPLFRYNPELSAEGKNPLTLDSAAPKTPFKDRADTENRFKMLEKINPEKAKELAKLAQKDIYDRWTILEQMARQSSETPQS
jgi:pyruvate-ferredoxin/flavodoxin oxidoreductase